MSSSSLDQAKYGALISYITIGFYILSGVLYTPYLISKLGISDYGIYNMSISVVAYFSIDFGIGAALTRFIARYRAQGCDDSIKNIIGLTTKLYLVIDFFVFVALSILYLFADSLFSNLTPNELERFKTVFLITAAFILISFPLLPMNGILLAYERIIFIQTTELISKVLSVLLLVLALWLGYGLFTVVLVNSIVVLTTQFVKLYLIQGRLHAGCNLSYYNKDDLHSIGSFSLWATVATIADKFFFPIIPFLLAALSNTTEVSVFAIVAAIEGYVLTIARAMNGIFLPKVMKHVVADSDKEILTSMMIKVGRVQLYIVGMIVFLLFAFGRDFIRLWVGESFDTAYLGLLFVLSPCIFHLTMGIGEELILAENKVMYRAIIYLCGSAINIIAILLLSPRYGAIGASISVSIAFIVAYNILAAYIYQKKIGLNMTRFYKECHFRILPFLVIILSVCLLVNRLWESHSLFGLLIKIFVCAFFGFFVLWLFVMNSEEKELVLSFVKNSKRNE